MLRTGTLGRFIRQNVIALLALFLALGGTSFAAASYINGKQIKPHSIPKNRLTNSAIAALHGARGTRGTPGDPGPTGARGPTGTRGTAGSKGATGAKGTKGDQGPTGASGPSGPSGATGPAGPSGSQHANNGTYPSFTQLANSVYLDGHCGPSNVTIDLAGPGVNVDVFGFLSDNSAVHNVDVVEKAAWALGDVNTTNVDFTGMVAVHGVGHFEHVAARGVNLGSGNGCDFSWMVTP
jgi:hypothetical protein